MRRGLLLAGALACCLAFTATSIAGKSQRVGTATTVETSAVQGAKKIVVTGVLQSVQARCERQRSVLLYEAGPTDELVGPAIGHAVSQGGAARGSFTIAGKTVKKISPNRHFIVESVQRKVRIKKKSFVCKRGVSIDFPGNFP
jgi:hypothetical protein